MRNKGPGVEAEDVLEAPATQCVSGTARATVRTTRRDTIYGYRFHNDTKLKEIFSVPSAWVTNQITNGRILLLQGIKDYDGVSALPNYDTQRYSIYEMQDNKITPLGTIDREGIFFSGIHLVDRIIYIARRNGIYIYENRYANYTSSIVFILNWLCWNP